MIFPIPTAIAVRTPDGDLWPTHRIRVSYDGDDVEADVDPYPPAGSRVVRKGMKIIAGTEVEVELELCQV